jgi:2-C-methyl-D-erythritol 4-phosphate cytidylyltransferase
VVDTIKRVSPAQAISLPADRAPSAGPAVEQVVDTPDRALLRAVQTPQGFDRALLERAHAVGAERAAAHHLAATDDAGLVEALGEPVHVVAGEESALKITTERDLAVAHLLLEEHR